jgi:signal transduction histidine kinase
MAYAVSLVLVLFGIGAAQLAFVSDTRLAAEIALSFVNVAPIFIAVAASIAVLHYRLYDIDLVVNRTLVYGALSLLVVGMYILIVGSVGAVFQARGSLLISLAATGVIAVLFQPMRERLQRDVNRLLYGDRDQPYEVLSLLGRRLEGPGVPEAMLASIVRTIAQALKLPYVAIAFSNGDARKVVSEFGDPTGAEFELPLAYKGGRVGLLICGPRGPSELFTDAEQKLLQDIAVQAAVAVHALKLSAALQRSRERLVMAREEERRRLRRDLHDGLGPHLASLGLKLDAAHNLLRDDPQAAGALLLQLRRQVKEAVGDVRRLTDNLRPPVLDELGLLLALRTTTGGQFLKKGLRIDIEGPDEIPPLPAAVEVAVYRIVQEAVTNVARHANATSCSVRLRVGESLELEILDDGIGLPESIVSGIGLESMRERTAELGGRFRIEPLPERGTKVMAWIPLVAR